MSSRYMFYQHAVNESPEDMAEILCGLVHELSSLITVNEDGTLIPGPGWSDATIQKFGSIQYLLDDEWPDDDYEDEYEDDYDPE